MEPDVPHDAANAGEVSFAEERLWFLHALDPASPAHHVPLTLRLRGQLDVDALQDALTELVRRHDRLRTRFRPDHGRPRAVVGDAAPLDLPFIDLRGRADPAAASRELAAESARSPFDLAHGPLLRGALHRTAAHEHVLALVLHQIVADAPSCRRLQAELQELYAALVDGRSPAIAAPSLTYGDLAAWQRAHEASPAGAEDLAFWRSTLADLPPPLELPSDRPRPAVQPTEGATRRITLPPELREGLVEIAERSDATLFTTLLAGFTTLLHRLTGMSDLAVGVPVDARPCGQARAVVGQFVNPVVVRVRIEDGDTFVDVVQRVRAAYLDAFDHRGISFERLVEDLRPERDTTHTPIVQTFFQLRDREPTAAHATGLELADIDIHAGGAAFDLSIDVCDRDDGLLVRAEYATALFDEDAVARVLERFALLLGDALKDPRRAVGDLRIATDDERDRVAAWSRGPVLDVPELPLHGLVARRAVEAPNATALIDGDRRLSRRELDAAANRLANHLVGVGVAPGDRVTIALPRSAEAVVAELAVMKAGAVIVPLDLANPPARLRELVEDAEPVVMVTDSTVGLHVGVPTVVQLDVERSDIDARADEPPSVEVAPDDPVWLMFTSGSTGRAKGVIGRHRTEVNRATWRATAFPPRVGEVHAHRVPSAFVDKIIEVHGALAAGLTVVVVPQEELLDPWRFVDLLARERVTRAILTPSHLRALLEAVPDLGAWLPDLRLWNISGEPVPAELARRFFRAAPGRVFVNTYGSTEAPNATFTALHGPPPTTDWDIPAGTPTGGVTVKVTSAGGRPEPIGVVGELWIGGAATALGYLGEDAGETSKFVTDADGERWYRTGDLAMWGADGALRYRGRIDTQVKVRGMRVEPGDVEVQLGAHPGVLEAVVVAVAERDGTRLVGHVRAASGIDAEELRSFLRERIPPHAVPSAIVLAEELPRTTSGKVDRAGLALAAVASGRDRAGRSLTDTEAVVAGVWADLLDVDATSIGPGDDFFDVGGHSLAAIELVVSIEQALRVRVPLRQLFETPTLEGLSRCIDRSDASLERSGGAVCFSWGESERAAVFSIAGLGSTILGWRRVASLLDDRLAVYGLEGIGLDAAARPLRRIADVAEHHLELVRKTVGDRPIVLGGHSFGGLVAYEMALRHAAAGGDVRAVVLLDTQATGRVGREPITARQLGGAVAGTLRRRARDLRRAAELRAREAGMVKATSAAARVRWVIEAQRAATSSWHPAPYDGRVVVLTTDTDAARRDPTLGWGALASRLEVRGIPGVHEDLLADEWAATTAATLEDVLLAASAPGRRAHAVDDLARVSRRAGAR